MLLDYEREGLPEADREIARANSSRRREHRPLRTWVGTSTTETHDPEGVLSRLNRLTTNDLGTWERGCDRVGGKHREHNRVVEDYDLHAFAGRSPHVATLSIGQHRGSL